MTPMAVYSPGASSGDHFKFFLRARLIQDTATSPKSYYGLSVYQDLDKATVNIPIMCYIDISTDSTFKLQAIAESQASSPVITGAKWGKAADLDDGATTSADLKETYSIINIIKMGKG